MENTWKEIRLDEIGTFKGAGVDKTVNENDSQVSLINYMDVYHNWRLTKNTKEYQIVTATDREIKYCNLLEGDVLFTPSSEKPIDIGHASVVVEDMDNCVYSYHTIRFRPNNKNAINKYLLSYLLNTENAQRYFISKACGSGIRYTLNLKDFRNFKFIYPEYLPLQTAIASILTHVDNTISSVERTISKAERLKKSLMQNLLSGRMKPDGSIRTEAEFWIHEKLGKVPVGWDVKKVKDVFDIKVGGDVQNYSDIRNDKFQYPIYSNTITDKGLYGYTNNPRIQSKESITIVGRGVGVGHCEYRKGYYDAIIRLLCLLPHSDNEIDCLYVYFSLLQFARFNAESTGVPQLTRPQVEMTKILIPQDKTEQTAIAEKISLFDETINAKQQKIKSLVKIKKSLMQQLLTGKKEIDADKVNELIEEFGK